MIERGKLVMGESVAGNRDKDKGLQVAYLEDDAPTREEHDGLEKRLKRVERKVAAV